MSAELEKAGIAIRSSDLGALEALLKAGLNPNISGGVLLLVAVQNRSLVTTKFLIQNGARTSQSALFKAIESRQWDFVKVLVTPEGLGELAPALSSSQIEQILALLPTSELKVCTEYVKKMKPHHQVHGTLWLAEQIKRDQDSRHSKVK